MVGLAQALLPYVRDGLGVSLLGAPSNLSFACSSPELGGRQALRDSGALMPGFIRLPGEVPGSRLEQPSLWFCLSPSGLSGPVGVKSALPFSPVTLRVHPQAVGKPRHTSPLAGWGQQQSRKAVLSPCGTAPVGQVGVVLLPAHRWVLAPGSDGLCHPPSGTIRPVRRSYYDPSSAPGKGVVWEWENDSGTWTPYDMDVGITIQRAYEKQHPWVDLSAIGFCYVIDFATMGQINRQTQRKRRVRRRLDMVYPLVSGTLPKSQSWPASPGAAAAPPVPACTCPQCLLVMSVKAAAGPGTSTLQPRKAAPAPPATPKPPLPAAGPKAPDGVAVVRGSLKPLAAQGGRRQAASTPALSSASASSSPPGVGSGKGSRPSLGTLNRSHLQRLAIAQSRVLIASG